MNCPACDWDKSEVKSTTAWPGFNSRKRECCRCHYVWSTYEMHVDQQALLEAAALVTREMFGKLHKVGKFSGTHAKQSVNG